MADRARRVPTGVGGEFFVDTTCIDCAACRWIAPTSFDESGDTSRVYRQPETDHELLRAEMAILACPVGAIGSEHKRDLRTARAAFPDPIAPGVFHCGYHAEESFGAASYLLVRPEGNILIDSPRFTRPLVRRIEALGGVRHMFLTHRDDVAEHARFAAHFGCERILHRADVGRETREVEMVIEGSEPHRLDDEVLLLPVPGHTRGSMCLLYREAVLFSGDHLAYSPTLGHVHAFRDACWYSWSALEQSMQRLARHRFEWVLPGHGHPCHFDPDEMRAQMDRCLSWMRAS